MNEKWLEEAGPQNLLDYVCGFHFKLHHAYELLKENLSLSKKKRKGLYDREAESRAFAPRDKVLVLLPIPGYSLQARCSGPYVVQKKVGDSDYLIATLD